MDKSAVSLTYCKVFVKYLQRYLSKKNAPLMAPGKDKQRKPSIILIPGRPTEDGNLFPYPYTSASRIWAMMILAIVARGNTVA